MNKTSSPRGDETSTTSSPGDETSSTSYPYVFLLYSSGYTLPYIPHNTALGLCAILLDALVARLYVRQLKGKNFVAGLYLAMVVFDSCMVVGLLCQYAALGILQHNQKQDALSLWVLLLSKSSTEICYRVSVFANLLMGVTRTIKIARPFFLINKRVAMSSILLYLLFWVFLGISETALFVKDFFDISQIDPYISFGRLGGNLCHNILSGCTVAGTHCKQGLACTLTLTLLLPLLVPCFINLACLALMIHHLRKPCPLSDSAKRQRLVSVTVTWLTLVFFLCISPSVLYYLTYVFVMLGLLGYDHNTAATPSLDFVMENLFSTTLPLLNTLLTPAIIVYRSKELKENVVTLPRGIVRSYTNRRRATRRAKQPTKTSWLELKRTHSVLVDEEV